MISNVGASNRAVITGLGAITPLGSTYSGLVENAIKGTSGVRIEPAKYRKPYPIANVPDPLPTSMRGIEGAFLDRVSQLALVAAAEAMRDSRLETADLPTDRIGVFFGSGMGGAASMEEGYIAFLCGSGRPRPSTIPAGMASAGASHIAMQYRVTGPVMTYASACASSALAVGEAMLAIRYDRISAAIVVGAEAILTSGFLAAWDSLRVLARVDEAHPERTCRPFSRQRTGIVLGEGAAALVLENERLAIQRGATIGAEVAGYGLSCDASHLTIPDASGQQLAMRKAIEDAQETPESVSYVNAHGTGTLIGDVTETRALKAVFGKRAYEVPVSSTKAVTGHPLGAAGVMELAISCGSLARGLLPPTMHLEEPDTECDLDYIPSEARSFSGGVLLSNSFAFGGTNVSLLLRRYA